MQLREDKCKLARTENELLGFDMSEKRVKPHNEKLQGISEKMKPKKLKNLRSYLGAVNHLTKFISGVSETKPTFQRIVKKGRVLEMNRKTRLSLRSGSKESSSNYTLVTIQERKQSANDICDASHQGLCAQLLQKKGEKEWELISRASRYLSDYEIKDSTNELELLAIVWAVEQFRSFIYSVNFEVSSDHKVSETALKSNHGNKTYSSKLVDWPNFIL